MGLTEAVRTVLSKYATFSGRASRPEFWYWVLATIIVGAILGLIDFFVIGPVLDFNLGDENSGRPLSLLFSLAFLLPGIAVAARRLHDQDRSGWWLLVAFVPVVGVFVLIYWYIQPGSDGDNRFGRPQQA